MARVKRGVIAKAHTRKNSEESEGILRCAQHHVPCQERAVTKAARCVRDRRQRKRQFHALWISRINAASRVYGLSYSRSVLPRRASKSTARCSPISRSTTCEGFGAIAEQAKAGLSP